MEGNTNLNEEKTSVVEETNDANEEANNAEPKKQGKIAKLKQYIIDHPDLKQVILFTCFSAICGLTQMIITMVLPIILRAANHDAMVEPFKWWIFDYTEKGIGEFIGFIIGSIWGQTLTFLLNRKKTFNAPDHVLFRAIAYTVMAILIIIMQTAIGGGITNALAKTNPNASEGTSSFYNLVAQLVASITAFVVSFLGNKFVIMRKWKTKEEKVETATKEQAETAETNIDSTTEEK